MFSGGMAPLRFVSATLGHSAQVVVFLEQPVAECRIGSERDQQALFIVEVMPDLRLPGLKEAF